MKNLAIIENNIVINIVLAENNFTVENSIEYKDANPAFIGGTYDADADAFIAPRPECGHKELFLNDRFQWNCQGCEVNGN